MTADQAQRLSIGATVVPLAVGAVLLYQPDQGLFDPRAAAGDVLVFAGATLGPSVGYIAAGMDRRAQVTSLARLGAFLLTQRTGGSSEAKLQRAAGVAAIAGLSAWDLAHVRADVESHVPDARLGFAPVPDGTGPALAVSAVF